MKNRFVLLCLLVTVSRVTLFSQGETLSEKVFDHYSKVPQEKVYVQTDRHYYMAGDTVWFRAHLVDAASNVPVNRSRFVYVELYDQQADTLCQRIMVKADEDGVFASALFLPKDMLGGVYTLAAYTQWMRNFGAERFFYKPLVVATEQLQHLRVPLPPNIGEHPNPQIDVSIYGEAKSRKEEMAITVTLHDAGGHSPSGIYSLSVADADAIPAMGGWDINQYMCYMDSLFLVHGNIDTAYPFQTEQLITGSVRGTLKKHLRNPHLLVVSHQEGWRREFELGDSTRFALAVDIPENSSFTLEATRHNGSTSLVALSIDSIDFPHLVPPSYQYNDLIDLGSFVTQTRTQQMFNRNDYFELPEVVKTGKLPKPQKRNWSGMEAPRGIPAGDPLIERASTVRALLTRLGIHCWVDAFGQEHLNAEGSGQYVGKVYVDNMQYEVGEEDCEFLSITPNNISSIEYFPMNHAQNSVFGVRPMPFSGTVPGVLFIFLKDGSEVVRTKSTHSLSMATVRQLGYRPVVEFYSPQYPLEDKSQYTRPDHRLTLYWNPKVRIGKFGKATVSFYTSDVSKRYLVTLEGVSDDGTVVNKQVIITP